MSAIDWVLVAAVFFIVVVDVLLVLWVNRIAAVVMAHDARMAAIEHRNAQRPNPIEDQKFL